MTNGKESGMSNLEKHLNSALEKNLDKSANAIPEILSERGGRYGSFRDNARMTQALKQILREVLVAREEAGKIPLMVYHVEAIEMIFHKISRIVSGDPNYADNWDDIAGYALLGKEPR